MNIADSLAQPRAAEPKGAAVNGETPRVFFHGLNELRALAALAVLFCHIELYKQRDGLPSLYDGRANYFVSHLGKNGVFLFFVLSGFLITYLLLQETRLTGTIRLGAFYMRRILRIWPLYFVIIALSFGVLPLLGGVDWFATETSYMERLSKLEYGSNFVLHLVFASNLALLLFPHVVGAAQTWSVSVEEQFYAIWPLLMRFAFKRPWLMLLGVIVTKLVVLRLFVALDARSSEPWVTVLVRLLDGMKFELMAVGGLGAWMMVTWPRLCARVFSSRLLLLTALAALGIELIRFSQPMLVGVTCAVVLMSVVEQRIVFRPLGWVGRISYGVYMYHPIAMFLGFALAHRLVTGRGPAVLLLEYALVLGITALFSVLSFRFIEQPFLSKKHKYSAILSG